MTAAAAAFLLVAFTTTTTATATGVVPSSSSSSAQAIRRRPFLVTTSSAAALRCRGGESDPPIHAPDGSSYYDHPPRTSFPDDESNEYYYGDDGVPPPLQQQPPARGDYDADDDGDPLHETVQHRVEAWKTHQREYGERMQTSPRDERGRVKLLTSVGKGSRAVIFFFLMWRNVHLYEVADQTVRGGLRRLVLVVPLVLLFFGNLMGVVASLSTPGHAAKRRLKAVLNMDKLVETLLILYSFGRLTVAPSPHVNREIHIANIFHSILFILQCQAFTRLSWDEQAAQPMHTYAQQPQQQAPPAPYAEPNDARRLSQDDDDDGFGYDNPYARPY